MGNRVRSHHEKREEGFVESKEPTVDGMQIDGCGCKEWIGSTRSEVGEGRSIGIEKTTFRIFLIII